MTNKTINKQDVTKVTWDGFSSAVKKGTIGGVNSKNTTGESAI